MVCLRRALVLGNSRLRHAAVLFVMCLAGVSGTREISAQGSTYVPVSDISYDDLDGLVLIGLVQLPSLVQRPYSRFAFARFTVRARINMDASSDVSVRFVESLARLETEFASEIGLLCELESCDFSQRSFQLRKVMADVSMAQSPGRSMRTAYSVNTEAPGEKMIEGTVNPLLQRNQGRSLADGRTFAIESVFDLQWGSHISAQVSPRVWIDHPRSGKISTEATMMLGYVRGVFGGFGLEVGRNQITRGRARGAGPLLSTNPRGLDMARLVREDPWHLPWIFRFLGPVTGAAWVADMGLDRHFPHSKLVGFELGARPTRHVELGLTLANHQGGEGAPGASWIERLGDIFLVKPAGVPISDKVLAADLVLSVPNSGLEFFTGALSTDPNYTLNARIRETWWDEAIWIMGLRWVGLGPEGRVDLWVEGRRSGVRPHTHHQYKDGLTIGNRVLGDPLGPLANSWQVGIDWQGRNNTVQLELSREIYSGDDWVNDDWQNEFGRFRWSRSSDNPDETRLRIMADWAYDKSADDFRTYVRFGWEKVTYFNFTDVSRRNYLAQVQFAWMPD